MRTPISRILFAVFTALAVQAGVQCARGQVTLPEITVTPPKEAPKPKTGPKQKAKAAAPVVASPPAAPPESPVARDTKALNAARENILPKIGVSNYEIGHQDIEARPQGTNAPLDKVLLQAPGVTMDSAASGSLHVRNEHANLQYRINGIIIPDGVSGFGQLLETSFVGSLSLVTGALPAQYGLRTSGLVDIETRSGAQDPGGTISIYGGNRSTLTPSIEYGGASGRTEYFFTGRGFFTDLGLENPTPAINAIHDQTQQGRAFGYTSTLLDPTTRLTSISGISIQNYQIPNNPGQPPRFTAFGISDFDSADLNQRQYERNFYNVIALQKKLTDADLQIAYFSRYSTVHFRPDLIGDLVFNGVASDVFRGSFYNGVQADAAFRLNPAHTLRTGFVVSGENSQVTTRDTLLPVNPMTGAPIDAPFGVVDSSSKLGWLMGVYLQDEWKLSSKLTLNLGIRFDQMDQYVDANQFSPRANLVYKPLAGTTLHFGYARYFTPPEQVIAAPTNLSLFDNTTQQPASCPPPHPPSCASPVLPERSHYFDVGITQKVLPGLEVGLAAYYKLARDLLDDGQFGQAYVLTGFNYDRAYNKGIELKVKYKAGNLQAYSNLALAVQKGTDVVSNQFLFDPDELAYIASHYIYTDHAQIWTGSAGVSYLWKGTRFSTDMVYGSGLRNGFANTGELPFFTQVNAGISHEFKWDSETKPTTVRFDVINVFDTVHEIRDGTGIGVFAPQFGPRRAFYFGLAQKF
jgi:outer membrane receptor protein involved in Fe transport